MYNMFDAAIAQGREEARKEYEPLLADIERKIADMERQIADEERQDAEIEQQIAEKNREIERQIAEKNREIEELREKIRMLESRSAVRNADHQEA